MPLAAAARHSDGGASGGGNRRAATESDRRVAFEQRSHNDGLIATRRHRRQRAHRASLGCANAELMPTSSDLGEISAATLCLVNRERILHGLTPLKRNGHLKRSAKSHTDSMIEDGYFGHYGPGGQTPADRMKASGYICSSSIGYSIGENIAWGTLGESTPKAIVQAWMASPGHRENILSATYKETGIGVLAALPGSAGDGEAGATYTQDFGVIVKG